MPIAPHEIGWRMLMRAERRKEHAPVFMRSAQSHPPVRAFVCDLCANVRWAYVASDVTPVCTGGYPHFVELPDE